MVRGLERSRTKEVNGRPLVSGTRTAVSGTSLFAKRVCMAKARTRQALATKKPAEMTPPCEIKDARWRTELTVIAAMSTGFVNCLGIRAMAMADPSVTTAKNVCAGSHWPLELKWIKEPTPTKIAPATGRERRFPLEMALRIMPRLEKTQPTPMLERIS